RMAVLAGLEAVDWVVSFAEDTPEALLEQVRPDVLVKGGDYGIDQVVGAPIVQAYGGEVKVLKFVDSCSTTAIVEKIRRQDSAAGSTPRRGDRAAPRARRGPRAAGPAAGPRAGGGGTAARALDAWRGRLATGGQLAGAVGVVPADVAKGHPASAPCGPVSGG